MHEILAQKRHFRKPVQAPPLSCSTQRQGAAARNLFHLGGRVFHRSGADAVRIRFAARERAVTLVVDDGPLSVTAARVAGA